MKDSQSVRRIPLSLVVGACALILAVGGGVSWWVLKSRTPTVQPDGSVATPTVSPSVSESPSVTIPVTPPSPLATTTPAPVPTTSSPVAGATAELWYIQDTQGQLDMIPHSVALSAAPESLQDPQAKLEAAFSHLLTHRQDGNLFSSIPEGTQMESLKVVPEGIYINLSSAFVEGGGSTAMIGRLGQVIYTATSLEPTAPVWISVEGKPLEYLGGEGLEVPQPITRQIFEESFLSN